jgi:hypothetical protein
MSSSLSPVMKHEIMSRRRHVNFIQFDMIRFKNRNSLHLLRNIIPQNQRIKFHDINKKYKMLLEIKRPEKENVNHTIITTTSQHSDSTRVFHSILPYANQIKIIRFDVM